MAANNQALAAVSAKRVSDAYRALALPASRGELEVALRAEVITWLEAGGALRAANGERLPKQEVNHQADRPGHKAHQHGPQPYIHSAPAPVPRDVADPESAD